MSSTDGERADPRSTAEVLASIAVNLPALVAKEVELLGLEVRRITSEKLTALALFLLASLTGLMVLGLGAVTVAKALEGVVPSPWIAWALVTLVVVLVTVAVLAAAVRRASSPWTPVRTAASLRDTAAWARDLGASVLGGAGGADATDTSSGEAGTGDPTAPRGPRS